MINRIGYLRLHLVSIILCHGARTHTAYSIQLGSSTRGCKCLWMTVEHIIAVLIVIYPHKPKLFNVFVFFVCFLSFYLFLYLYIYLFICIFFFFFFFFFFWGGLLDVGNMDYGQSVAYHTMPIHVTMGFVIKGILWHLPESARTLYPGHVRLHSETLYLLEANELNTVLEKSLLSQTYDTISTPFRQFGLPSSERG